jgi:tetratricopeptide (TPR) repeat protein
MQEALLWQLFRSQNLNGLIDLIRNYDASHPKQRTEILLFFEKRFATVKENNFGLRFFIELSLLMNDPAGAFLFMEEYYERTKDLELLNNYVKKLLSLETPPIGFVDFLKKYQREDVLFTEWLAEAYAQTGHLNEAHGLFQDLIETYPQDINIKKRAARMALKAKDFASAAPLYEVLIKEKNITLDEMIHFVDSAVQSKDQLALRYNEAVLELQLQSHSKRNDHDSQGKCPLHSSLSKHKHLNVLQI